MIDYSSINNLKETVESSDILCLFGVGVLFEDCFMQMVQILGKKPDFLCDNSEQKWGRNFLGIKCISPNELEKLKGKKTVVIAVRNYENIYKQLRSIGIEDIFMSCYERRYNSISKIKKIEKSQVILLNNDNFESSVKNKWTFITGASRGIGRQIALQMAKLGSNIIVHGRTLENTEAIIEECSKFGIKVISVAAELSDLDAVNTMLENIEKRVSRIDIVFNNAGISPPCISGFWDMSEKDYLNTFRVNTLAPIRICTHLIPKMIKRGYGRIINVTSSIQNRPKEMAYACSKAALNKFVYDLAPSLQNTGVMLTLLDPGWLQTDMGGGIAPCPVESVIPGAILGAILDRDINGYWISAQDYAGLSIEKAIQKAKLIT